MFTCELLRCTANGQPAAAAAAAAAGGGGKFAEAANNDRITWEELHLIADRQSRQCDMCRR